MLICKNLLYKFCLFSSELRRVYPGAIDVGTASYGTRKFARWEFVTNVYCKTLHTRMRDSTHNVNYPVDSTHPYTPTRRQAYTHAYRQK